MKANRFGTYTEQEVFRNGYKTSKERQAAGIYGTKCDNCHHLDHIPGGKRVRCNKLDTTTTINAICNQWEAKERVKQ